MTSTSAGGAAAGGQPAADGWHSAGFEVLGAVGRGSHSVVYRVRRHADGAEYALKLFSSGAAPPGSDPGADGSAGLALRREAALLATVNHPGVARVHEAGAIDGRPYLLLDLVEGRRLSDVLTAGPLGEERLLSIGADVADALAAAHRAGLVHRDVKPDNIVLCPQGTARLIDFGLATPAAGSTGAVTAGTLAYCAPEQAGTLSRPVDGRADLYSLGVVLFECATGTRPFVTANVGELLRQHAVAPVPDPREWRPELSPALAELITRLLAKDPDDRYPSAIALRADLTRGAARARAAAAVDEAARAGRDLPLVARQAELATLRERWERARQGTGGVTLVCAAAGGGKSRLARELTAEVAAGGGLVLHGTCSPVAGPLASLRAVLGEYLRRIHQLPAVDRERSLHGLHAAAGLGAALLRDLTPEFGDVFADTEPVAGVGREPFAAAVAGLLLELARRHGGLLLHLDDVQWLDDASCLVLQKVAQDLRDAPLFVVATGRDDAEYRADLDRLRLAAAPVTDPDVELPPLDEVGVAELVSVVSGGLQVDAETARRLAARSGGNPFTLLEYCTAIVDAGLAEPNWGTWRIDLDRLDHLDLHEDAAQLVLERVDPLNAESRRVLGVAAVIGLRFPADLLTDLCGDRDVVMSVLADAAWRHLIERRPDGDYAFLHDRIREALLSRLDAAALRELHDRVADALEPPHGPHDVYAVAHHRLAGDRDANPLRSAAACQAAGALALADHSPAQAITFLEAAAEASRAAGAPPDVALLRLLGRAYHDMGRFEDAVPAFQGALELTEDPVERAVVLDLIARVHLNTWDVDAQEAAVEQALRELGRPLPKSRLLFAVTSLGAFLAGCLVGLTRIGYGTLRGRDRELARLQGLLYEGTGMALVRRLRESEAGVVALRSVYLVNRLGLSPENVRAWAGWAYIARAVHLHRLADRCAATAMRRAQQLGDPQLIAYVAWVRGVELYRSARDGGEALQRALDEHGRWMDPGLRLDGLAMLPWEFMLRGNTASIEALERRRETWIADAAGQVGVYSATVSEAGLPALRGQPAVAAALVQRAGVSAASPFWLRGDLTVVTLLVALEQQDVGPVFEAAAEEFDQISLRPPHLLAPHHSGLVYVAYGRLEQCRAAVPGPDRTARVARARRSIDRLGRIAKRPLIAAHHRIAQASLLQIMNRHREALAALGEAEPVLFAADSPLAMFEAARVRARALLALGLEGEAARQATYAIGVAQECGWPHRMQWIRAEFAGHVTVSLPSLRSADAFAPNVFRDRLAALEEVSLAASRALEPEELARIALDVTIRILGAERALLFLLNPHTGELRPHLGRDNDEHDLPELNHYSATVVDHAWREREAVVVTGTEDGVVLGADSVAAHGLRSIMAAPLRLDERMLGVVYLDSRVAKGIFTEENVTLLRAIAGHVAVSLETARTVKLELEVEAAHRQRDLAETLRAAMSEVSGTLDPDVVLQRLVASAQRTMRADRAWLVTEEPPAGVARVPVDAAALAGVSAAVARSAPLPAPASPPAGLPSPGEDPATDDVVGSLQAAAAPVVGGPERALPTELLCDGGAAAGEAAVAGSWMAVPLRVRQRRLGLLVLATERERAFGEAQVEIAATMAEQGMVAYENAQLFSRVRELATIDGLTQIANRRHLIEAAEREVALARKTREPLAAIMVDIDHFKRINDTYGHQAGDEVIRGIASRLARHTREGLVGRYGGEEFVLLVCAAPFAALRVAERLREEVAATLVETSAGPIGVTISAGVAFLEDDDETPRTLLARADACLYRAKRAGRDRVVSTAYP
jgi:diguanylate cyclase (GGDEF)-like protein